MTEQRKKLESGDGNRVKGTAGEPRDVGWMAWRRQGKFVQGWSRSKMGNERHPPNLPD
jgi:hypothetical protein